MSRAKRRGGNKALAFALAFLSVAGAVHRLHAQPIPTTTTIAPSATSVAPGTPVALAATVLDQGGNPVTTGTVVFTDVRGASSRSLCSAQIVSSGSQFPHGGAYCTFFPPAGTHTVSARFIGTSAYGASSASTSITVPPAVITLNFTLDVYPLGYTTSISPVLTGFGPALPTGTIRILDTSNGNAVLDSFVLDSSNTEYTFSSYSYFSGNNVVFTAVADLNRDGILDLVSANAGDGTVSSLLGDGAGRFIAAADSPFAAGATPVSIAMGDFNRDGVPDAAVAVRDDDSIAILFGDGNGRLLPGGVFPSPAQPQSVAVDDVDRDGILDILSANAGSNDVLVLVGDGAGGFNPTSGSPLPVGLAPRSLAIGDLNGDEIPDLAVANSGSNDITILLGDGDGAFSPAPGSPIAVGIAPHSVATGYANGDPILDLVVANRGIPPDTDGSYTILLGNGTGFIEATGSPLVSPWHHNPLAAILSDVDADGDADLITSGEYYGTLAGIKAAGSGQFRTDAGWYLGSPGMPYSIASGDFNGDGNVDFVSPSDFIGPHVALEMVRSSGYTDLTSIPGGGTHQLVAEYSGDANYASLTSAPAEAPGSLIATTLSLTANPPSAMLGETVTLIATLSPGSFGTYIPAGTVTFLDGAVPLCSDVVVTGGVAVCTTGTLPAERHSFSATYSGDFNFAGSSSPAVTVNVTSPTTTNLVVSPASGAAGELVTLIATVTDAGGNPVAAGTVTFCDATKPFCSQSPFGVAQIAASGGGPATAALRTRLPAGTYSFRATFEGTGLRLKSSSDVQSLVVTAAPPSGPAPTVSRITWSGSAGNYTLTGSASGVGRGPLTGTFTFVDAANGNYPLGPEIAVTSMDPGFAPNEDGVVPALWTPVGNRPEVVAAGDFNDDGWPDVAVASYTDNTIAVFLGDGAGNFAPAGPPLSTSQPSPDKVVVRDTNGDDNQDLLVFSADGMAVWLGDGTGQFAEAAGSPIWIYPIFSAAVSDFNRDGHVDAVVSVATAGYNAYLLTGNGDGSFAPPTYPGSWMSLDPQPAALSTADMNGDGNPDLIASNTYPYGVSVHLGDGNGSFTPAGAPVPLPSWSDYDDSVAVGDVNADGLADVVVLYRGDNEGLVAVLLGDGHGGLAPAPGSGFSAGYQPHQIAIRDFNADGNLDLAFARYSYEPLTLLLGDGHGSFTPAPGSPYDIVENSDYAWGYAFAVSDFNADGVLDAAMTAQIAGTHKMAVLLGGFSATATLTNVAIPGVTVSHEVAAVYSGDAGYSGSTSTTLYLDGSRIPTTVSLTVTPDSGVVYRDRVTLQAALSPVKVGQTLVAGGTFRFQDGVTSICTNVSFDSSGRATCLTGNLTVGAHNFRATYSGDSNFLGSNRTASLTVAKATPVISWTNPASISYGTRLGGGQLNATTTVSGTFAYNPGAGTLLPAGTHTLSTTFTPTTTNNYTTATSTVSLTVNKATPAINWATPLAVTYGTPLSATQLNATSPVAGTFAYTPAAGAVLPAGTQTLSVTFTPTDTANYDTATRTVSLVVNRATPTVTWTAPAPITYGTPIGDTQLNATASVPGSFVYNPSAGTTLGAGQRTLSVTFTPTDTANYDPVTRSVLLTVNRAAPEIAWAVPAPITYGTALSATQLNASASVTGTFVYDPPSGAVLSAGPQNLSVSFAPSDTANFTNATKTVLLTVNQAVPTITWETPAPITYGTTLSETQLNATASVPGTLVYDPAPGSVLNAGPHTLAATFTPTDNVNYTGATQSVELTVNQAVPTITWETPVPITYGTALSEAQLNATASVPGSFVYSSGSGTTLPAGAYPLTATFTPTDTVNYTNATRTITLTVNRAVPTITWQTPSPITYGTALTETQLDATASVPGAFAYDPALGVTLPAGPQTLTVSFVPDEAANYTNATQTVVLTVNQAVPTITWQTPAPITYGTVLGEAQLNATASVPGTFAYDPASGVALGVGLHTLSVTFTPVDRSNYTNATQTVPLTVNRALPAITWEAPAAITYGTALSEAQLNASASVPGTFTYNPSAGTVLEGGAHTLSVQFVPADQDNYSSTTASVPLFVNPAPTATTIDAPESVYLGQEATITVTVSSSAGIPSGSVTLLDGPGALGTAELVAGVASFSFSPASLGNRTISVQYGGNASFGASTGAATLEVLQPRLGLLPQSSAINVRAGQSGTAQLTVAAFGPLTSQVVFTCSGLPEQSMCSFAPASVGPSNLPGNVTLTITTTAPQMAKGQDSTIPWTLAVILSAILLPGASRLRRGKEFCARHFGSVLGLMLLAVFLTVLMPGCGDGGAPYSPRPTPTPVVTPTPSPTPTPTPTPSPTPTGGTPVGTYSVTVTATSSGAVQAEATIMLTVTN